MSFATFHGLVAAQSFGLSARYDHAFLSDDDASTVGLISTNQVVLKARTQLSSGNAYATVNTRVGRGYTELGSRGAELGYDQGEWFLGLGQSTGTEFSWITATAVTGNVGNLALLSAFPKKSVTLGFRLTETDTTRLLIHGSDGTRVNAGAGQELSWVRKQGHYTFRIAHHRMAAFAGASHRPWQSGASLDSDLGPWRINIRHSSLRGQDGERLDQSGVGAAYRLTDALRLVADTMISFSDVDQRDYSLVSLGAFWDVHPQADIYLLGYKIRNDAQALRLVGSATGQSPGDDPRGVAVGVRFRLNFENQAVRPGNK